VATNVEGADGGGVRRFSSDFDQFYRSEYASAVRLVFLLTHSNSECEEIAQDALTAVCERFGELERPGAYLRITIVNACRRWHRRQSDRSAKLHLLCPAPDVSDRNGSVWELVDIVAKLPYEQRVVIVCRYWGGWTQSEVAEMLDCPQGTVKSLQSRALDRIRREVGRS
jgi:RNA polymerase sigma factor (sigma-70 family)